MTSPFLIGPRAAREILRAALAGELPPNVIVLDPHRLDFLDIEIRPDTITRMRLAGLCQRTMDAVRNGELRHDG